jgi:CHAD domain-containing protein
MAKATYEIPADATLREAARIVLQGALTKMIDNTEGTRAGLEKSDPNEEDIEYLHDMRVGSRRLRASLSVFGKVFSKDEFRDLDKEAGRVTDALGVVRDLDVQLDGLRKLQASLPENEAYGIGRLLLRQTKLRNKERKKLLKELALLKKEKFSEHFQTALERSTLPYVRETEGKTNG